ncbi:hypothetical protein FSP39_012710 [Pinctada imbricata]|uniref:Ion transport domain-containing protein n=1 Tax=Pinctada imbricata TaxID=66713 RepID=A0AA88XLC9_PINIB|nr:hypothetical protein FSP39_012710 [Pinctada imbricata]
MGNTSVVATGVKNQGDGEFSSVYKLVDLKGGGELVDLMKRARWTKNFKEIDEKIQTAVKPFLYDGGRGKKIPICEIVEMRNKERQNKAPKVGNREKQRKAKEQALLDMKFQDHEGNYLHNKPDRKFRECCWDITKRGTVGDQILHLCLLNASAIHYDLAKRLIQQYPKLINDIYLGDEYYGESVLHIAIVNEDPAMVKFILDHGGDYHERACGNFFCPDDQKDTREDSYDHEWVEVTEKTNYEGYVYFGEYPLSFAACLGQEECVRLLIAKGANPNLQDTNGNTDMFDLLLELGARLDIKNRQGLTPLTLAAVLARKSMYEHILEKIRQVMWIYGKVTCAGYPLKDIDTISETGEINKNSVLNLVVYGEDERHLDMMDGLIVELLKDKWKTFVRFRFYRRFAIFFLYFIMFMVAFILRPGEDKCPTSHTTNTTNGVTASTTVSDSCYLLKACSDQDYARFALEIMILIGAVWYIFIAMKEIYHQGFRIFFNTLRVAPAKTMFLMSCVLIILMLPGRAACQHEYEDIIGTFAILFTAPYFLFFCRGFKIVGPFVVMIYRMVMGDLLRWFIIYAVFIVGFSQSFYLAFINSTCDPNELPCVFADGNPIENIIGTFSMNVGEFEDIYATFEYCEYPIFMRIVFAVYMIMVTLLLVNMLIAMMGNTYQLVNETQKEYFRQWAKIVLVIEQSVTTNIRKQQRQRYSQPMPDGDRAFIIRWHQSEKEQEQMAKAREERDAKLKKLAMEKRKTMIRKMPSQKIMDISSAQEGHLNV